MKFNRRDFLQGAATVALAAVPKEAKAVTPASLGKNQVGLNGLAYYFNTHPVNNWVKLGNAPEVTLNMAGLIDSFTVYTLSGGTSIVRAHTRVPHGLWNPNYTNQPAPPVGTGGVGSWIVNVTNVRSRGSRGRPLAGWAGAHDSNANVTGPNTIEWVGIAGVGSPDYADLSVTLKGSNPPNRGSSLYGANGNPLQFIDANGDMQPNIANVTSLVYSQLLYTLDFANKARVPPGYSRAGQTFAIQWQRGSAATVSGINGTAPRKVPQTWTGVLDTGGYTVTINIPDPADPPKQIYVGPDNPGIGELALWNSGTYLSPSYEDQLKPICGVLRSMDWFGTNGNVSLNSFAEWTTLTSNRWGTNGGEHQGSGSSTMPFEVMMQLANRTNKHPWLNIPNGFTVLKAFPFIGITKSSPGSNAILTTGNPANPVQAPTKHNFVPGDEIIVNLFNTNLGAPFISAQVVISVASNNVTWLGHTFAAGQTIIFPNGGGFTNPGQSYYVTNPNTGAGTFQVANTLARALAGTPITFVGNGGAFTCTSQINHCKFIVGTVTDYTVELLHCDSSSFGATIGNAQYAVGNPIVPGGWCTTPVDLTHFGTQVRAMATAALSQLNRNLVPRWEFGNELWNTNFPSNTLLIGQAHNFVDANGMRYFADDFAKMSGYLIAHAFNAIRTVYGGLAGRSKWIGNLATHGGSPDITMRNFAGMDYYIHNTPGVPATRNDYFDNVATVGYWGGGIYQTNGTSYISSRNQVTFTVDPAGIAPSKVTVHSNSNLAAQSGLWAYPFIPIIFDNAGGTLPVDLATGLPLDTGGGDNGGALTTFNISGINSSGVMTTIGAPPLVLGQTVYGPLSNDRGSFWNFTPRKIIAILGANSFQTDNNQIASALNGLTAMDYVKKTAVYWTIPPSTGTTLQFARTVARFTGSIAGNTLTVITPPHAGGPQIAIGQKVGGIGVSERTVTAGSGLTWTLNGAAQTVANAGLVSNMGSYAPVVLDPTFSGVIASLGLITAGSGYTNGSYTGVSLIGGSGSGATAKIAIAGGLVTAVTIVSGGAGYTLGDTLSASAASIGGTGSGFSVKVNPGSGQHFCVHGSATLLRNYMNDSISLNMSNPSNWPSKYSYFDYKMNEQLKYLTDAFGGAAVIPFNGAVGSKYFPYFIGDLPPLLVTSSIMPNVPGLVQYEGANGNYPVGQVPGVSARGMNADPQFCEFVPQAVGTNAQAAVWKLQDYAWRNTPGYAAVAPAPFTLNTTGLVMGEQAFFTDAANITSTFQFATLYFVDDVVGIGSPNWQNSLNQHPVYDALVATN